MCWCYLSDYKVWLPALALVVCIQAVSVLAIKQLNWFQSQDGKQQQLTAAYVNEAEPLETKADKTIAATFSLSENCDIYIVIKKKSLCITSKSHKLLYNECFCENKQESEDHFRQCIAFYCYPQCNPASESLVGDMGVTVR